MSPVVAGKGSTLGFRRTVVIQPPPRGKGWDLPRAAASPTQGHQPPFTIGAAGTPGLSSFAILSMCSPPSASRGLTGGQVDGFRVSELVELVIEVHSRVLAVDRHAAHPGALDAALDRLPGVVALLVPAGRA